MSNAANEWCAAAVAAAARISVAITRVLMSFSYLGRMALLFRPVGAWRSEVDAGLAGRIDGVAIVLFADVLGDRPVAMALQHVIGGVRSGQDVRVGDRRFDRHRIGIDEPEPFDDLHLVAVCNAA